MSSTAPASRAGSFRVADSSSRNLKDHSREPDMTEEGLKGRRKLRRIKTEEIIAHLIAELPPETHHLVAGKPRTARRNSSTGSGAAQTARQYRRMEGPADDRPSSARPFLHEGRLISHSILNRAKGPGETSQDVPVWRAAAETWIPGPNYRPMGPRMQVRVYKFPPRWPPEKDQFAVPKALVSSRTPALETTLSEEIGVSYSPQTQELSPRLLQEERRRANPQTYRSTSPRLPSPPASPRLAPEKDPRDRNDIYGRMSPRMFGERPALEECPLPLETFDNLDYEQRDPLEWVELGRATGGTPAMSQFYNDQGDFEWRPCHVVDFETRTGLFVIEWEDRTKWKRVHRFNLVFEEDHSFNFHKRLTFAQEEKDRMDCLWRKLRFAEERQVPSLFELPDTVADRFLRRVASSIPARLAWVIEECLAEVRADWRLSLKVAITEYEQLDPEKFAKLQELGLPPPTPRFRSPEIVPEPFEEFEESRRLVGLSLLRSSPSIMRAVGSLFDQWQSLEKRSFFDASMTNLELPITVDEFFNHQRRHREALKAVLVSEWVPNVAAEILQHAQGVIEFYTVNFNQFSISSQMQDLLRVISLIQTDQLRVLVEQTIHGMVKYFEEANQPLLMLEVAIEHNGLALKPPLYRVERDIIAMIDEILSCAAAIPKVDRTLLSLLEMQTDLFLPSVRNHEDSVRDAKDRIRQALRKQMKGPEAVAESFKDLKAFLQLDSQSYLGDYNPRSKTLQEQRQHIELLRKDMLDRETAIANEITSGMFQVSCLRLKELVASRLQDIQGGLLKDLAEQVEEECNKMIDTFKRMLARLEEVPKNVEELMELKVFIDSAEQEVQQLEDVVAATELKVDVLDEFLCGLTDPQFQLWCDARGWPNKILDAIYGFQFNVVDMRRQFLHELREHQNEFSEDLVSFSKRVVAFSEEGDLERVEEFEAKALEFQSFIASATAKAATFQKREGLFGIPPTQYDELDRVRNQFEPILQLWKIAAEFERQNPMWNDGPFVHLNADQLEEDLTSWHRILQKLQRELNTHPPARQVAITFTHRVGELLKHLPFIKCLRNPGLRDRHWESVSVIAGLPVKPAPDLTLRRLLLWNLEDKLPMLQDVSEVALKELNLENALEKMTHEWKTLSFTLLPWKGATTYVLKGTDDILNVLDDHIVKTQSMLCSPFAKPFHAKMLNWEQSLKRVSDVLDEWLRCQRGWIYLSPIFSSDDILKQMPAEARRFTVVDVLWRRIMEGTHNHPAVLARCMEESTLGKLQEANKLLDTIQKGLNDYLEMKRRAFPRFYFLSNDELLEILSQTKDPKAVQPHLRKCFENVSLLEFDEHTVITAMHSAEKERVPFLKGIDPNDSERKGSVERWLSDVERAMRDSLQQAIHDGLAAYENTPRTQWILEWPGQVVLVANQVIWTQDVSDAITYGALPAYRQRLSKQLDDIVRLVRGELSVLHRITLGALVVIDVHLRDIVTNLEAERVKSLEDFEWTSQLRYYFEGESLKVRMVTACLDYGYEYLGNTGRLVITPLTDRCYRTLMGALHLNFGGAPEGPAGTGKTETVKDLAKAIAKQCVVFNCSDGLDYIAMAKFFKGLAMAGAWSCFDEFNRIDVEVLSVIAQQLVTIQRAIGAHLKVVVFEGAEIPLDWSCSVFITMNPGYAGRTELPDNLKALFRPVAMMIPDYAMIAEISLYSCGFADARNLARKVVACLRLCSEQLSAQEHYDFGMRNVKSILSASGQLRHDLPDLSEDLLTLRAIIDCNLPKFLQADIPLFQGIITDLFPDVEVQETPRQTLVEHLHKACEAANLQVVPDLLAKCIQLYETILVRHGIMLVGRTMSGKSTSLSITSLAVGETECTAEGSSLPVRVQSINPKAVTLGQLYGQFDPLTHEWTDGILANTVRMFVLDSSPCRKWVVFDGPVDAVWIENMNTVLDDNKKLCLTSGEIISLTTSISILFEVEDLSAASPATVSRCGMVYMEQSVVGWGPIVASWLAQEAPEYVRHFSKTINGLFHWLVPPSLAFVRSQCVEVVTTVDTWLVRNLVKLFHSFLQGSGPEPSGNDISARNIVAIIQSFFLMSLVWSIGASVSSESRAKFSKFLSGHISSGAAESVDFENPNPTAGVELGAPVKLLDGFPCSDSESAYDLVYDRSTFKWGTWQSRVPGSLNLPASTEFNTIIVPTADSIRYSHLLNQLILNQHSVLFTGATGTGKTVVVTSHLSGLTSDKWLVISVNFSATTTANQTQDIIDSKLEKRRKGVFGPVLPRRCLIFVDDLNMPAPDKYGAQPPIELLRQWMDYGGWFDRKTTDMMKIVDCQFVAAMAPPGGGRNAVSLRYLRHFNLVHFTDLSEDALRSIFCRIMDWFLGIKASDLKGVGQMMVAAAVSSYTVLCSELLPTPSKSHYLFNLRDLSKVFQGITVGFREVPCIRESLLRMWVHEMTRVFADRLVDDHDKAWFVRQIARVCEHQLGTDYGTLVGNRDIKGIGQIYVDFLDPSSDRRPYVEVKEIPKLQAVVQSYLDDYNAEKRSPMQLVLFDFALEHLARITRILRQPLGHALLVGVGGSGRQSLSRLAAHIYGYHCFQIDINKSYGKEQWRDDVKKVLKVAGLENHPIVFLLADQHLVNDAFLEDINNLLNSGEIPNLYNGDELQQIVEIMTPLAPSSGKTFSRNLIMDFFVQRCKSNLHIVLCMSPVGNAFRNRLRMFPSLVSCCTIDWFSQWPPEALVCVAQKSLRTLEAEDTIKETLAQFSVEVHESAILTTARFKKEMGRKYYITATHFLDLLHTFRALAFDKHQELLHKIERYETGLSKLLSTGQAVGEMQKELEELKPVLIQTCADVDELLEQIGKEKIEVDVSKQIVQEEEAACTMKANEAEVIKLECEVDLAEAMPALEAAMGALGTLNKNDIAEVKVMKNPPGGIRLALEAVCIMKQLKPVMVPGKLPGQRVADWWETSKRMLTDPHFLQSLYLIDKDDLPEAVMSRISIYTGNPEFDPDKIAKASKAAMGLCKWVRAIEFYHRVSKVVGPKKEKLQEADAQLKEARADLKAKKDELQLLIDRLDALMDDLNENNTKKDHLASQVELCEKKLMRARKLIGGLGGERHRWSQLVDSLKQDVSALLGNAFVAAAQLCYVGAFDGTHRTEITFKLMASLKEKGIPHSADTSLLNFITEPVEIRKWATFGLPPDNFSVENAVLILRSTRVPLIIDPQKQASRWLKALEKARSMRTMKANDPDIVRTLENCVQFGLPALIEDVGEEIEPVLLPLVMRQTVKQGNQSMVRVGDELVELSREFRLYLTTNLPNPHYSPELCGSVCLVNFTITPDGLQDQLLNTLVAKEKPLLEQAKSDLIVQSAQNAAQLKDLEDKILMLLSTAKGNILEDESLIDTLTASKQTSAEILEKMKTAELTEKKINDTRAMYKDVAVQAARVFFLVALLHNLDCMYQFSLSWFSGLFTLNIDSTPPSPDTNLLTRLSDLVDSFNLRLYQNVCRSLFAKHKLVFSFLLTLSILDTRKSHSHPTSTQPPCHPLAIRFLLAGPGFASETSDASTTTTTNRPINPAGTWLPEKQFDDLCELSRLPIEPFSSLDLIAKFSSDVVLWQLWAESPTPFSARVPSGLEPLLLPFHRVLLVKCLRPDKVLSAVQEFIVSQLGPAFVEAPPLDVATCFEDSSLSTPLIFVLSAGADPTGDLMKMAESMSFSKKLVSVSLGQGQGPIAERAIKEAMFRGSWVLLQNCHLALSWMPELEKLVESVTPDRCAPSFRLWLTSMPSSRFPVSILHNGVKMIKEPPLGLRANLTGSLLSFDDAWIASHPRKIDVRRLVFSLCTFHAVVQERRRFGPLGWNIPYEYSDSDLQISVKQLYHLLLDDQLDILEPVPFKALIYLTGQANYGGRVTDEWDRRTLLSLLSNFYNPQILQAQVYNYSPSGLYNNPASLSNMSIPETINFVKSLPINDDPEVFGLHSNASMWSALKETNQLLKSCLALQHGNQLTSGSSQSDSLLEEIAKEIESRLPILFNIQSALDTYPTSYSNSMNTVLVQELIRFNRLLSAIRQSLQTLQRAIRGLLVMSRGLEELGQSLLDGVVPADWKSKSYTSLKPLGSWVADLCARCAFMKDWLTGGQPTVFWISAFFFTQSFLTGILQNHARSSHIPIDTVEFSFQVMPPSDIWTPKEPPSTGCYISGLFLEGARWDSTTNLLADPVASSSNAQLQASVPIIWLKPIKAPTTHPAPPTEPKLSSTEGPPPTQASARLKHMNLRSGSTKGLDQHRQSFIQGSKRSVPVPHAASQLLPKTMTTYQCPVYKTSARAGTLSTTGHSTNYIFTVHLPTDSAPDHWIRRGAALLTQLDY